MIEVIHLHPHLRIRSFTKLTWLLPTLSVLNFPTISICHALNSCLCSGPSRNPVTLKKLGRSLIDGDSELQIRKKVLRTFLTFITHLIFVSTWNFQPLMFSFPSTWAAPKTRYFQLHKMTVLSRYQAFIQIDSASAVFLVLGYLHIFRSIQVDFFSTNGHFTEKQRGTRNNGVIYQPQLVKAGVLNHHQQYG